MQMIERKTISCVIFSMVLLGPLLAGDPAANAQGLQGTRLAQAMINKQKLRDALLDRAPKVKMGRTRGIVLGAPVQEDSRAKRRVQGLIRKHASRSPVLPGPSLLQGPSLLPGPGLRTEPGASPQKMTKAEREELKKIATDNNLPAVDMEIYFKYNSAQINPRSLRDLAVLGQVLNDPKLINSTFMVAGYTDAKGSNRYNQSLSERRAQTVREFLQRISKIAPGRLLPVGYGEDHLKNNADPFAAENRRVQIVNLSAIK